MGFEKDEKGAEDIIVPPKVCPFFAMQQWATTDKQEQCVTEKCAWYHGKSNGCAIASMPYLGWTLDVLRGEIAELKEAVEGSLDNIADEIGRVRNAM